MSGTINLGDSPEFKRLDEATELFVGGRKFVAVDSLPAPEVTEEVVERLSRFLGGYRDVTGQYRLNTASHNLSLNEALTVALQPGAEEERLQPGIDYAITVLAGVLGIAPDSFSWDAATEEFRGDVGAVIGNALTAKFGDDWQDLPAAPKVTEEMVERVAKFLSERTSIPDAFRKPEYFRDQAWFLLIAALQPGEKTRW